MSKRILVVDDYPAMLALIQAILEAFTHYSVRTANDRTTAQTIVGENQPFDLALLDVNLGKLSGLELVPIIRQYSPACAIVYVTGREVPANLLDERPPYTGYLRKPFHVRDFLGEVRRALNVTTAEPAIGKSPALNEVYTVAPLILL
jgi:CheY-like chemotaxis protein